jgi:pyruvate ferredoxin oxidoreductase alpha subunit
MRKILEGSRAIAETVNAIKPDVVSAYPITPQTHIVEDLAKLKANGEADYEYVRAESEFAAISIVEGASATGVRTYTATSSQGLLLMTEVIYNVAGMRLPIVMTCANRAVSAPINIWNDQQDAVTMRDSGWLMLFGEDNQEVCDLHILAYKIAEKLSLPVMVNLDGFILTHTIEPVEVEDTKKIQKFLPDYKATDFLDVNNPLTLGAFATPEHYFEIRKELHDDIVESKEVTKNEMKEFERVFGRKLNLIEYYGDKDADTVIIAMGSILGTIKDSVEELQKTGEKIGILKVVGLRPFADKEIIMALKNTKNIAVIDKSISLGTEGILATEIRRVMDNSKKITSFIVGLGGRDIRKETIKNIYTTSKTTKDKVVFIGK